MDFKEILRDIVRRTDGGMAAILMGYDGIAIDEYIKDGVAVDIQLAGIEYSSAMKEVKRASRLLEAGDVGEVSVVTDNGIFVVRIVNDEYFLLVNLTLDGNLGKARYLMRLAAPKFRELL